MFRERIILVDTSNVPETERHTEVLLRKFPFRIGGTQDHFGTATRGPLLPNDLVITEKEAPYNVAEAHVEIGFVDGKLYAQDLDTPTGTVVNGQRLGKDQDNQTAILNQAENEIILGMAFSPWRFKVIVPASKRPRRLLIADDDQHIRNLLNRCFGKDFDIVEAEDGVQALEICRKELPDLAIIDWIMPQVDGFKVCKILKSGLRTGRLPIILITGMGTVNTMAESVVAGADDYLPKPLNMDQLRNRVNSLVRRAEQARDIHCLTGVTSETAFRDEIDALLATPMGGAGFQVLVVRLRNLEELHRKSGATGVDDLQREVAELLWQFTLRNDRALVAQLLTGVWALLLPNRSGRKIAGFNRGKGRDAERELEGLLDRLLKGRPVKYRFERVELDRVGCYAAILRKF